MFNPTPKIKKLLGTYGTCAYIHSDGVVVTEKKEISIESGTPVVIDVWHIIPCEIRIRATNYARENENSSYTYPTIDRLVIHDCELIANGFDNVEIAFNNNSNALKERGLSINKIYFRKGNHKWYVTDIMDLVYCPISIQPDVTRPSYYYNGKDNSIRAYLEYKYRSGNSIVVYGEIPEEKTQVLQLAVSN